MKKIFNYLLACTAIAVTFTACRPLSDTDLGAVRTAITPPAPTVASITLTASDYSSLSPTNPAQTAGFFHGTTDAFASIPSILNSKYPKAGDKSQVTVTYATSPAVPAYFKAADSTYAHLATSTPAYNYTLLPTDYAPIDTHGDFTAAEVLQWLLAHFTATPPDHQVAVLTYVYYDGAASTVTQAFIYLNGAWKATYTISPAQYASVNRASGATPTFVTSDNIAILTNYFNTFLKSDPVVATTAKIGDVRYVAYRYNTTYIRFLQLAFDGTNWISAPTTATNLFTYSGGTWTGALDNTVRYTLVKADYTNIGLIAAAAPILASSTAITNMTTNSDFTLNSSTPTSRWTDTQIANSIILGILKPVYASSASVKQKFLITFSGYSQYLVTTTGGGGETYTFVFDGTNFVYQPTPDNAKYTITGDDYAAIAVDNTTGATPGATGAMGNLLAFGDFSMSGASAWTQPQINIGIANVLKTRYTAATSGQTVIVSYAIYSGGNQITTTTFKYGGTTWTAQ